MKDVGFPFFTSYRRTEKKGGAFMNIIPAEDFCTQMSGTVEPFLASVAASGFLPADGEKNGLYYDAYVLPESVGGAVFCHGYSESAEKLKEVAWYFLQEGYSVFVLELRGHGRSLRLSADTDLIHVRNFSDYVEDLHRFVQEAVRPVMGEKPLYLWGHSMGGGISALYNETYPDTFCKVILSSPMFKIQTGRLPERLAQATAGLMCLIGKGERAGSGKTPYQPGEPFATSAAVSRERFVYYAQKRDKTAAFHTCAGSFRWIYTAMGACRRMRRPANIRKMRCPVLLLVSPGDTWVDTAGMDAFAAVYPRVKTVSFSGTRHELYNATDAVLEQYYTEIFSFLKSENDGGNRK